jgi:hypothetical protein
MMFVLPLVLTNEYRIVNNAYTLFLKSPLQVVVPVYKIQAVLLVARVAMC